MPAVFDILLKKRLIGKGTEGACGKLLCRVRRLRRCIRRNWGRLIRCCGNMARIRGVISGRKYRFAGVTGYGKIHCRAGSVSCCFCKIILALYCSAFFIKRTYARSFYVLRVSFCKETFAAAASQRLRRYRTRYAFRILVHPFSQNIFSSKSRKRKKGLRSREIKIGLSAFHVLYAYFSSSSILYFHSFFAIINHRKLAVYKQWRCCLCDYLFYARIFLWHLQILIPFCL